MTISPRPRGFSAARQSGLLAALVLVAAIWGLLPPFGPRVAAEAPAAIDPKPDITFVEEEDDEAGTPEPPSNPFGATTQAIRRTDAVPGSVEVSTGLKIPGRIYTTRAKRLKIYNLERQVYEYVPVAALACIEAVIEWERNEQEWRFKEAGSPEKVYTGRTYPVRMLGWKLTLRNGHQIAGHILGQPLYAEHNGKAERFILNKRHKGAKGEALEDLVYIRRVAFGPEAYNEAVRELKAKAEAAARR